MEVVYIEYLTFLHAHFSNVTFYVIICLMIADTITGILLAIIRKSDNTLHGKLESRQLIKGLYKKIGELVLYFVGTVITYFSGQEVVYTITAAVIIGHEGLSVIENLALLGIPIPAKLKDVLEVLSRKEDKDE